MRDPPVTKQPARIRYGDAMNPRVLAKAFTLAVVVAMAASTSAPRAQTGAQNQEQQLQDAIRLMEVKGEYVAAARLLEALGKQTGSNRNVAARARLKLAELYEQQGKSEAERTLRGLIAEFAEDQPAIVAEASERLRALTSRHAAGPVAKLVRRPWTLGPGLVPIGAPSRDGRSMPGIDAKTGDLVVVDLATHQGTSITGLRPNGQGAAISPDGREIAVVTFVEGGGGRDGADELRVARLDGGATRTIHRNEGGGTMLGDWTPDGKRVLVLVVRPGQTGVLAFLDTASGSEISLHTLAGRARPSFFSLSRDGQWVVFDDISELEKSGRDIFALDVKTRNVVPLVVDPSNDAFPIWTPDGKGILFASDRTGPGGMGLWLQRVSEGHPTGNPQPLETQMGRWSPIGIGHDGTLYFNVVTGLVDVLVAPLDLAGNSAGKPVTMAQRFLGSNLFPGWSADSRLLAFSARRGEIPFDVRSTTIVVHDMQSGEEREITPDLAGARYPRWSPDGRSLTIGGVKDGTSGWCLLDVASAATEVILPGAPGAEGPPEWDPRGGRIVLRARPGLQVFDLATRERRIVYESKTAVDRFIAFSHDGERVAFAEWTSKTGTASLALRIVSAGGGDAATVWTAPSPDYYLELAGWSPDDRELLFVRRREGTLYRVSISGGSPRPLGFFAADVRDARISPDGRYLAYTVGNQISETRVLENFLPSMGFLPSGGSGALVSRR